METAHTKEETKRLRTQLTDLRDKLADLDARVTSFHYNLKKLYLFKSNLIYQVYKMCNSITLLYSISLLLCVSIVDFNG